LTRAQSPTSTLIPYTTLSRSAAPALSVLAVPVAYLCYRFVEEPFRRRPARARPGHRRTVAVGVAASVLLGLTSATSAAAVSRMRSEAHTSELQSRENLVCRLL